jgi:DNA repair protein RadC
MTQLILDLGVGLDIEDNTFAMACGERPQERLENFGVRSLSDTELIATVLQGNGTRAEQAVAIAARLMAEANSIHGLASWHPLDYRRVQGIGRVKGLQLAAIAEIGRRMMSIPATPNVLCNRADEIAALFRPMIAGLQVEKFWVSCLSRKNRLIKMVEITSGTATSTLAHPREVFREALRHGAIAIVCVHNHPSGDPAPSAPDLHVTRVLREAAKAIDITLLDHVIVGSPESDPIGRGYFSFKEAGFL